MSFANPNSIDLNLLGFVPQPQPTWSDNSINGISELSGVLTLLLKHVRRITVGWMSDSVSVTCDVDWMYFQGYMAEGAIAFSPYVVDAIVDVYALVSLNSGRKCRG